MNKGFGAYTLLMIVALFLAGYAIYYLLNEDGTSTIGRSKVSQSEAMYLVSKYWASTDGDLISVEAIDKNGQTYIYAKYSLRDNAIAQSQQEGVVYYEDGEMKLSNPTTTFACTGANGKIEFSKVPCR